VDYARIVCRHFLKSGALHDPIMMCGRTPFPAAVLGLLFAREAWTASLRINTSQLGPTFDGLGAVSAGTGPRLLVDYPDAPRQEVLDFLFLPHFGANIQVLKVEIGGTGDSTQGTEDSHEPQQGQLNPNAGYELWVAKVTFRPLAPQQSFVPCAHTLRHDVICIYTCIL